MRALESEENPIPDGWDELARRIREERYVPTIEKTAIVDPDGKIFSVDRPGRHHDVIRIMTEAGSVDKPGRVQGFLTSCGVFVTRYQAAKLAMRAGQIEKPKWGRELYSEDLW